MVLQARSKSDTDRGFLRGLQTYGDRDFSIYMHLAFAALCFAIGRFFAWLIAA